MNLRTKLLLPLLVIGLVMGGYLFAVWIPRTLAKDEAAHLRTVDRHLDSVVEGLIPLLLSNELDIIHENLSALQAKNSDWVSIELINGKGQLLYPLALAQPAPRGQARADVRALEKRIQYLGIPLGRLSVEVDLRPALANIRRESRELAAILYGMLAIIAVTTLLTVELAVAGPVRQLADASRKLARREFDTPLPPRGTGEVGALVNSFAVMRDDLHRYEVDLLKESAERKVRAAELRSVLDTMVEGVVVANAQGEIVLVNHSSLRLFGLEGPDQGRPRLRDLPEQWQLRDAEGRPLAQEQMSLARALAGETVLAVDETIRPQGSGKDKQIRVSAAPIRVDSGIRGAVLVARDITELCELERLKDQFLSVAAHELKTPVTVMKGFAEVLLRKGLDLTEPRRRMLEAINRGADRIDTLILDLLDISRMGEARLELTLKRIDLLELIKGVVCAWAVTAPRRHIQVTGSEAVVTLGDRHRLQQVLNHLLSNAIKYSPGGEDIDVSLIVSEGQAIISVEDRGVGIPADKQGSIFQRFYRAHTGTPHDYGGMGIRLFIAKEIVTQHGGRMWFVSHENEGSIFSFSLPLR